jgi:hypothetical protein
MRADSADGAVGRDSCTVNRLCISTSFCPERGAKWKKRNLRMVTLESVEAYVDEERSLGRSLGKFFLVHFISSTCEDS